MVTFWQDGLKIGETVKVPKRGGGHVRVKVVALDKINNTVKAVVVARTDQMDPAEYTPYQGSKAKARFLAKDVRRG